MTVSITALKKFRFRGFDKFYINIVLILAYALHDFAIHIFIYLYTDVCRFQGILTGQLYLKLFRQLI